MAIQTSCLYDIYQKSKKDIFSHSLTASMAARIGSLREKLLSAKGYPDLGLPSIQSNDEDDANRGCFCSYRCISDKLTNFLKEVKNVFSSAIQMGKSDPRKIIFSAKMALALMLISLLVFLKEPIEELSRYYVWAILTVVVVFEFSIGI